MLDILVATFCGMSRGFSFSAPLWPCLVSRVDLEVSMVCCVEAVGLLRVTRALLVGADTLLSTNSP